jgi:hypothetical protein
MRAEFIRFQPLKAQNQMNVTFSCPGCQQPVRSLLTADTAELKCLHCGQQIKVPHDAVDGNGFIHRCVVCPSAELFLRKDFPQRLGVSLVVLGFVGSSIAWGYYLVWLSFAILFTTALIDLGLYIIMGESLTCYRCHAQYRGFRENPLHTGFDLETHERYRQMAARIKMS